MTPGYLAGMLTELRDCTCHLSVQQTRANQRAQSM
ncbi:hypothetical protein GA0070563_10249 [Micromonospora carbonacea]|uniref:Uncharacterized protein n=1 Tax=Micromonospora carbonacea TaxID=47853 RepID=A0A1C4V620_9ACTN|nr:hypothetical protein GA0070563_10249 [Micromonospora carbonacea]